MKILLAAGGSGGHIYPGLSIIQRIKKIEPSAEFLWVGTYKGKEREVAERENIDYIPVKAWSINNEGLIWKLQAYWFHGIMTLKLLYLMKKNRVDAVITTGGYSTASSLMAASLLKIPLFMHEQNVFPGLGTRKFARYASKIFTSFEGSENYLKGMEDKVYLYGNPVREDFNQLDPDRAREELGIGEKTLVVSLGGSLGSRSINNFIRGLLPYIEKNDNLHWIHIVGVDYEEELTYYRDKKNIQAFTFLHDLPRYLVASDLLISRSGASTITEISSLGKASILIPSPNVLDDHQTFNARLFSDRQAAILLEDSVLEEPEAKKLVFELLEDREKLEELALNSRALAPRDSAKRIAREILESL